MATQNKHFINEMEDLVNKFSKGPSAAQQYQRLSNQQSRSKLRQKSNSRDRRSNINRSSSKDRKPLTMNDKIAQEVEKKLKAQRKDEKNRIKQYGKIYGGDFSSGTTQNNINLNNYASKGSAQQN